MPELGKYAATVLSAYGISLALLALVIGVTWWQARAAKLRLSRAEARKNGD